MKKSNPKHKRIKLGLNNIHYYMIHFVANSIQGKATGMHLICQAGLLSANDFADSVTEDDATMSNVCITNLK